MERETRPTAPRLLFPQQRRWGWMDHTAHFQSALSCSHTVQINARVHDVDTDVAASEETEGLSSLLFCGNVGVWQPGVGERERVYIQQSKTNY